MVPHQVGSNMNDAQRRRIADHIETLEAGLEAHDLLTSIWIEAHPTGAIQPDLMRKLEKYFNFDDSE